MRRISLVGATGCLLLMMLTACSSVTHQPGEAAPAGSRGPVSASPPAPIASSTPTPAAGTPTASVPTAKSTTSAALIPMQTAQGGEFASPSGNITCEVNYQRAGLTEAYCQTASPARSVTLSATGTVKTCTGESCLGNSGEGTPTLAYGQATGVGPFRCESAATGVTCTAGGKGFRIANTGVTSVTS